MSRATWVEIRMAPNFYGSGGYGERGARWLHILQVQATGMSIDNKQDFVS